METLEMLDCDDLILLHEMPLVKYLHFKKLNVCSLMINVKYILKMKIKKIYSNLATYM